MAFKSPRASLLGHIGFLDLYALVRRTITRSQVAIIMYHHVTSEDNPLLTSRVSVEDFEREIAFMRKIADVVPLDVLADKLERGESVRAGTVCITFDDGFRDNYRYAYPILRKYSVPATVFLITGCIGSNMFWADRVRLAIWNTKVARFMLDGSKEYGIGSTSDKLEVMSKIVDPLYELSASKRSPLVEKLLEKLQVERSSELDTSSTWSEVLDWAEIREMSNNGISFGAHTVTHPTLTKVSFEEAKKEITVSKNTIEETLGIPCRLFAYPKGVFDKDLVRLVQDIGFAGAVTTIPRLTTVKDDPFVMSRIDAGPNYYGFKYSFSGLAQDLAPALNFLGRK